MVRKAKSVASFAQDLNTQAGWWINDEVATDYSKLIKSLK